ncbi:hypothetical protein CVT25_010178 [Psilocybe cyanescens]|uniref:Uncharacterized protein n=1 Tax=Psilocybe cyanescens TaxID=93625 RepID=A0A409XCY9_PSICY|nr:hypothetical protein CVT25_010178 [Psilocybe cyanescens]
MAARGVQQGGTMWGPHELATADAAGSVAATEGWHDGGPHELATVEGAGSVAATEGCGGVAQ